METLIEFLSPTLCFGPVKLYGSQNVTVPTGLTAVVGPSGAGKTTLGKVIERGRYGFGNRLRFMREGMTVKILTFTDIHSFTGVDVLRYDQRLESSENEYVPTVADLFAASAQTHLWVEMTERLNLHHVLHKKINYLSSGELRKLLIINALLSAPDILILDNPFIGLDGTSRVQLREALLSLRERGLHIILLLSDPAEIPLEADGIINLERCRFISADEAIAADKKNSLRDTPDEVSDSGKIEIPATHFPLPPHEIAFSITDGHARYGDRSVFENVTWTVSRGERWMLTGPNGSGKSLLLSMICGDNPQAYANHITIFDRRRGSGESIWDIKNNIGYTCPEMQLYFRSSHNVRGIIVDGMRSALERYKPHTPDELAEAGIWLGLLGIPHLAERDFSTLSSSEQKVVLLGRAFARQPAMLVLDEPFQGLDPDQKERMRRIIDALVTSRNSSLIFVTHYPDELPSCVTHRRNFPR